MKDLARVFAERYGTALIADAAFRAGAPVAVPQPGIYPLARGMKTAGPVRTVEANSDLVSILGATARMRPGDVLLIANEPVPAGLIGDLIAHDASARGVAGIVVDGLIRDAAVIVELGLPVFARGRTPVGPLKHPGGGARIGRRDVDVRIGGVEARPGMWLFGDDDGILLLEAASLESVVASAEETLAREAGLLEEMRSGKALGDLLQVDAFLERRDVDPEADFNEHLKSIDRAI